MNAALSTITAILKRALPLKELPRTGWIMEGAPRNDSDSVAAHSYSVSLISLLVVQQLLPTHHSLSMERVLRMAVLHDLGESITGEIAAGFKRRVAATPGRESMLDEIELEVFSTLLDGVHDQPALVAALHEFNECKTPEAKIVKFADVLDAHAHGRTRLNRIFERALQAADKKLRKHSPESDAGVGLLLAGWLVEANSGWDSVPAKPIS